MNDFKSKLKIYTFQAMAFIKENQALSIVLLIIGTMTVGVVSASLLISVSSSSADDSQPTPTPLPTVLPSITESTPSPSPSILPTRNPTGRLTLTPSLTKTTQPQNSPTPTTASSPTSSPTATLTPTVPPATATPTTPPTPTPTPRPQVTFTPTTLDFGTVPVGPTVQKQIIVSNQGPGALIITSTSISHSPIGACGSAFILNYNSGSYAQGGTGNMPVDFVPQANNCRYEATITINSNAQGSPHQITVRGQTQ